jgi:hypothetical protein
MGNLFGKSSLDPEIRYERSRMLKKQLVLQAAEEARGNQDIYYKLILGPNQTDNEGIVGLLGSTILENIRNLYIKERKFLKKYNEY